MTIDEEIIFELRANLEHVIIKQFVGNYDMPEGLNQTHMITLIVLYFNGSAPMSDLSQKLNIEKGSFTPVANKLIQLDYIKKERNEVDKRVYELSLTDQGTEVAKKFATSHIEYIKDLVGTLDNEQKDSFFNAVSMVNEVLKGFSNNVGIVNCKQVNND
ncbi:MarR family winged helix-turn-helix transcriptional regulator [Vallitalea okinawensis]|uniref:MarR family winged helix-turn-helix transcriptional regulator n=1 Tax=Vallitalea okinawensis TaxID=2078660 RepID=UPI000CFC9416|nr:MarR family transcriptional regulator [Vallitalea okinawensis]